MKEKQNYTIANTSMSHTFGNVAAYITEYVKSFFPKDYFSTINITSKIAHRHFSIFNNSNKEFIKKRKPMLIIRPRINFDDEVFMQDTLLTTRITDNFIDLGFGNLQPMFRDVDLGVEIRYLLNRVKISFDITIVVEHQNEQIDKIYYLKNMVRQNRPFPMPTVLESAIPREMMHILFEDVGIVDKSIAEKLEYLNSKSLFPVTYKIRNSTGRDEFFRLHSAELEAFFMNLSLDEGTKKGFISDHHDINFTISSEFFTSGLFYYFTPKRELPIRLDVDLKTENHIIPLLSVDLVDKINPPVGWNLYQKAAFKSDKVGEEIVPFSAILNKSVSSVIDHHNEYGIPMTQALKIFIQRDMDLLTEIDDFIVDYREKTITLKSANLVSTYRLLIYANSIYVNDLIADNFKFKDER